MANLLSIATGNWTTAGTWALVDTTSYLNSEANLTQLTTSYVTSSTFTPGAITIDAIAVKIGARSGTTGTISIALDQGGATVTNTEVAIDTADIPNASSTNLDGGWIVFKFSTSVTLAGATAYGVKAKTSSTGQVSLYRDGTAGNWSRMLRTTTTQAPGAGDDVVVAGEHTGSGTGNSFTVTMNETATTDYGSAPTAANSLITPGVAVCKRGTLQYGTTAATNYYLKVSNSVIVYNQGTLNIGTTGTPIPRDSTAVLEFDPAADGDYGLLCRSFGTLNIQGLSRTSGKNVVACKLNTDEAANSTSLGVDTDTGWLDNDQIAVASTTRTASQCEAGTLNGNAGASSLTVDGFAGTGGGLAFDHSGTSPTQAEVILLTRNVKIRSATSTLMAFVFCNQECTVDIDWAEFYYIGEANTNKHGIEPDPRGTGTFNMQFSSVHDTEDTGIYLAPAVSSTGITFSNNVMWNLATVAGPGAQINAAVAAIFTITDNILIRTGNGNGWTLSDVGCTFTGNTVVGATAIGISLTESSGVIGTFADNTVHSNGTDGVSLSSVGLNGVISGLISWRNNQQGIEITSGNNVVNFTIEDSIFFGNSTTNINAVGATELWLKNVTANGDTTFSTTNGINFTVVTHNKIIMDNCDFSTVSGIKTAHSNDINFTVTTSMNMIIRDSILAAASEVTTQTNLTDRSYVAAQRLDGTAGNHKTWMKYGTLSTDSTIFNTVAPSMRMTPNNASSKLESAYEFNGIQVAVASGSTVTVNAYVRKSVVGDGAAYNGNEPRLILKANPAIGIDADAVLDTAAGAAGSFEQLSGTTAAATDNGVMEFVIDCDGTAGWVNVDDWS